MLLPSLPHLLALLLLASVDTVHGTVAWVAKAVVNTSTNLWGRQVGGFSIPNLAGSAVLVSASSATASEALVFHATTSTLALHINSSTPVASQQAATIRIAAVGDASIATRMHGKLDSASLAFDAVVTFAATATDASSSPYDGIFLAHGAPEVIELVSTNDKFAPGQGNFKSFGSVASAVLKEDQDSTAGTVLAAFAAEAGRWQGILALEHDFGRSVSTTRNMEVIVAVGEPIPGAPHLDFLCVSSPQVSPHGQVVFFGSHCGTSSVASSAIAAQRYRNALFRTRHWQSHCLTQQVRLGRNGIVDHVFPGIYRSFTQSSRSNASRELEVVADSSTAVPGGLSDERFSAFSSPAIGSEGTVSFVGLGSNGTMGVFAQAQGGHLRAVATTASSGPEGMSFGDFPLVPSVGPEGRVVFYATSAATGLGGVYGEMQGLRGASKLEELITESDTVDGEPIIYIGFGTNAANAGTLDARTMAAVYLVLVNGTDGIWTLQTRSINTKAEIIV